MAFKETGKLKSVNPLRRIHNISDTEFKLNFVRKQMSDGSYTTTTSIIRGKKEYHGNNTGLLHKAVNLKYRVVGDTPSLTKQINNFKPSSFAGKTIKYSAKATNFAVKDIGKTGVDVALASETATITATENLRKLAVQKALQKYRQESNDDVSKAFVSTVSVVHNAHKGLKQHKKLKVEHKSEFSKSKHQSVKNYLFAKDKFNLKKSEYKLFKKEKFKPVKKEFKLNKTANKVEYKKIKLDKKINHHDKKEARFSKKFADKQLLNQVKIAKYSKPNSLLTQSIKYSGGTMLASGWQKAISADERNDMMKSVNVGKKIAFDPLKNRVVNHKKISLEKQKVKRDKFKNKKLKKDTRLKKQQAKLGKKRSLLNKSKSQKRVDKAAAKGVAKTAHAIALALKSPVVSIVAPYGAAIVIVLCVILLILSMINGVIEAIFGNSSWVMGTYTAQDKYLSQAEEYYTKLAYEMNQNVLKCSTDDWEDGLDDLGVDTDDMDDDPDNFYFGDNTHFSYLSQYDFDCYKFWSFLSAYYYDFSTEDGEIEYWEYDGDTEDVIEELFNAEYKFECFYDNTSRWEEQSVYQFEGGIDGRYWTVDNKNVYSSKLLLKTCPSVLSDFKDDEGYIHFNSSLEILNPNDENKRTGWFIQDQRYFVTSPSGQQSKPFYSLKNGTTFGRDYSGEWSDREYFGFSATDQVYHVVSSGDTKRWNSSLEDDTGLISFYQRNIWKTDCRLYYNVKTKKSFDEAIKAILTRQSNGNERYEYYLNFAGLSDDENAKDMHGNHQSFNCPVGGSILDCVDNGKIYNGFGYDMQGWNVKHCSLADEDESHQAIDIIYPELSSVYAPMDGYIKEINLDESYVIIRKNSFNYWYDGDGCGKTRDTEITLYGVSVASNLSEDDEVHKGDIIAVSLPEAKCEDVDNGGIGQYYLHVKIEIDTDGYGWDFIDPRLVFY